MVNPEDMKDSADNVESNWDEVVESFDDMNLHDDLLRGIYAYGFERPSAIQQRAILPVIGGKSPEEFPDMFGHSSFIFKVAMSLHKLNLEPERPPLSLSPFSKSSTPPSSSARL